LIHQTAFIHPLAHVDGATIGARTKVWQFASITRGTVLGEDCSVSPFAMLDGSVYGDRVIISGGVMAGAGFKVGSDVFLGPNVVLANDCWPFASKDGYRDDLLRNGEHWAVIIEDGAAIGAGAVILPGITIGKGRWWPLGRSWSAMCLRGWSIAAMATNRPVCPRIGARNGTGGHAHDAWTC